MQEQLLAKFRFQSWNLGILILIVTISVVAIRSFNYSYALSVYIGLADLGVLITSICLSLRKADLRKSSLILRIRNMEYQLQTDKTRFVKEQLELDTLRNAGIPAEQQEKYVYRFKEHILNDEKRKMELQERLAQIRACQINSLAVYIFGPTVGRAIDTSYDWLNAPR